ncbi:MAG: hypothetical protein ACVCEJ_00775 [Candidatus Izemoplasmataceae bacterium]|uniref:Peptidoglycan linked protein n=1 Tax=Firmicutes bacterium enrichment culture clone fosmid MGS-M2 TaxID=1549349 RepID=A0A0B5KUC2_9FIRM|nr:peptidoglycan linked protein [Firmicutes bacterium enrichment culture clone fosmid MGS-M2]
MKRKGFLFLVMMLLAITIKTQAATYSNYLPGGKNYLNPENFRLSNQTIETKEAFKVLPSQTYTLTYPGDDMFFDSHVTIGGGSGATYADGIAMGLSQCDVDQYFVTCTFTTNSNETALYLRVTSTGAPQFYNYYGLGEMQLEEGSFSTSHEAYIAPEIDVSEPTFSESGAFILSYLDQTPIEVIIGNHITVHDEIDGDLSNQIMIEQDYYTNHEHEIGSYLVKLSATDSSGNKATFDLTVLVKDEIAPVIDGPSSLNISVNNAPLVDNLIQQYYTINDGYDGLLGYNITNDTYSVNKHMLGTYNVTFRATDGSSNSSTKSISLSVIDDVAPSIEGDSVLISPMSNPLTINDILATQTVSDNYSNLSMADTIVTDLYSSNIHQIGTYTVTLKAEDSSGNSTTKIINIDVIDDVVPVISGPVTYVDSYASDVTLDDIISLLSISDNNDQLTVNNLVVSSDEFTNRTSEVGTFIVVFELVDQAGNKGTHQVEITLVDDMPPVIYVDSYIINVSTNTSFSSSDALRLMLTSQELSPGEYEMTTLIDEYHGNEKTEGSYLYKVLFTSEEGEVTEKEFIIKVKADQTIFEEYLTLRNVILYGASLLLLGLTIYKAKK